VGAELGIIAPAITPDAIFETESRRTETAKFKTNSRQSYRKPMSLCLRRRVLFPQRFALLSFCFVVLPGSQNSFVQAKDKDNATSDVSAKLALRTVKICKRHQATP